MLNLFEITDRLLNDLANVSFKAPVAAVYNPLTYARSAYNAYIKAYGAPPKEILLIGMNPGPWGMVQTGVPFGEVAAVRDWMGIAPHNGKPEIMHPQRPVLGFECPRSEVSGKRLWRWAEHRFGSPEAFFKRFFVANYCPLVFMEESGKNRTPVQIRASERNPLLKVCDQALRDTIVYLRPRYVIGIGAFAADRAKAAAGDLRLSLGRITHPSPANPKANRGWEAIIEKELSQMGIRIPA